MKFLLIVWTLLSLEIQKVYYDYIRTIPLAELVISQDLTWNV